MILLTAFDNQYARGDAYEKSLKAHCNIPFRVFSIGCAVAGRVEVPVPDMPHNLMQEGGFLKYIPDIPDDEVIIFTDADMLMTRPFNDGELAFLSGFDGCKIGAGANQFIGATLELEYRGLKPVKSILEVDAVFPDFREKPIWNTGFIVAQKSTYAALHSMVMAVKPQLDELFLLHPRYQFAMSYFMGTYFEHVLIPQSIHAHGHFGTPEGATHENGEVFFNGVKVCFRHKI